MNIPCCFMWLSCSVVLVYLRKSHKRHSLDDLAAILDLVAILDFFTKVALIKLLLMSQICHYTKNGAFIGSVTVIPLSHCTNKTVAHTDIHAKVENHIQPKRPDVLSK